MDTSQKSLVADGELSDWRSCLKHSSKMLTELVLWNYFTLDGNIHSQATCQYADDDDGDDDDGILR